ncbi:MAG TPA: DUF488 domain-containing protein [Puia sp.]|nr:DUF488 domain-containing protein [Puia sp.]
MIKIKRIYEPHAANDGYRVLVDRLWPRGIKKETANINVWMKEIAPSTELRKWFNHEPEKWKSFLVKYKTELENSSLLAELKALAGKHKIITLLYGSKDEQHNQAIALKSFLQ